MCFGLLHFKCIGLLAYLRDFFEEFLQVVDGALGISREAGTVRIFLACAIAFTRKKKLARRSEMQGGAGANRLLNAHVRPAI